jgi:hypothetical protein
MNAEQIRSFVLTYLEAYQCGIVEKAPTHVTAKLSVEADKELTNRAYYWSFVERTGAPAETMTMTFVFDPPAYQAARQAKPFTAGGAGGGAGAGTPPAPGTGAAVAAAAAPAGGPGAGGTSDSILGRYFGFVPTAATARVPADDVTFGSRRLLQLFRSAKAHGRFVRLFEEPPGGDAGTARAGTARRAGGPAAGAPAATYETWLLVNYKAEFVCDMKRSEIHSLAISLATGRIRERFYDEALARRLTPRLPDNVRLLPDAVPLEEAAARLEAYVEHKVRGCDHSWADRANEQLRDELARIDGYYSSLLHAAEPDKRPEIEAQYGNRKREADWQYRPRIEVSVINCGFFHLQADARL